MEGGGGKLDEKKIKVFLGGGVIIILCNIAFEGRILSSYIDICGCREVEED